MNYESCELCWSGMSREWPGYSGSFDTNYSYGLGVCLDCGGIGRRVAEEFFETSVAEIGRLRFDYCSAEVAYGVEDPPVVSGRVLILEQLQGRMKDLFDRYAGIVRRDCFGRDALERIIPAKLRVYRRTAQKIRAVACGDVDVAYPDSQAAKEVRIAILEDRVRAADALLCNLLERFPNSSLIASDYGVLLARLGRRLEAAYWLQRALTLLPKRVSHLVRAGQIFALLKERRKSTSFYLEAFGHPDFAQLDEDLRSEVERGAKRSLE